MQALKGPTAYEIAMTDRTLVQLVAEKPGNSPAVCRDYYIHLGVSEKVLSGDFDPTPCDEQFLRNNHYRKYECRTIEILTRL